MTDAQTTGGGPATGQLPPLRSHADDVHSQFGEDGVIAETLRRLGRRCDDPAAPLWCIEFGAWNGVHLSNTRVLIERHGAHAVLIESDPKRFRELVSNNAAFNGVSAIQAIVERSGDRSLDQLLAGTDCPNQPDLLSIDVDGQDYRIWESVRAYHPTIVLCEYNPTIPYGHPFVPPVEPPRRTGCSLGSLRELGEQKGYALVAVTEVNAVFVRAERASELRLASTSISSLTEGLTDFRTTLFQTADGEFFLTGNACVMWHQAFIDRRRLQQLPRFLRRHHDELGPVRRFALRWLQAIRRRRWHRYNRHLAARRGAMPKPLDDAR